MSNSKGAQRKPFSWKKLGIIPLPSTTAWINTHMQNPFPEHRGKNTYRIHFASRDMNNEARGGWVEIDLTKPTIPLLYSEHPTIDLGDLGCFDDCGVMPSSIVEVGDTRYLYYTGWKKAVKTPFSFFVGLAVSEDGGEQYKRVSRAPVVGRTSVDPYMTAAPWVIRENGIWRMWYVSGTGWVANEGTNSPKHYYHIRYAESLDGIHWNPEGTVSIDFVGDEYAIARPVVLQTLRGYEMWYSYRGGDETYRIGYAESKDGTSWSRRDQLSGLDRSQQGYDSEMICYPYPLYDDKSTLLFYNGNSYGRDGVCVARLEGAAS